MEAGRRIRCVLFDLDGTLVNTWDLYIECYLCTLEPYARRRLSLEELIALGPTSELRFLGRGVAGQDIGEAHREFLRHYRALHRRLFGGVYPGVPEMLDRLRQKSVMVGIVTGKSRGAWEITAPEADLGGFDVVVTDEEVAHAKPDPAGLAQALARLDATAGEAVYVGDAVVDAQAAQAAGIRFAAALWAKSRDEAPLFLAKTRPLGVWAELARPGSLLDALERS